MGSCLGKSEDRYDLPVVGPKRTIPRSLPYEYDYGFKVVVVGDSGVGKSSLIWRFADNTFTENYMATIGVDFKIRQLDLDGRRVKLSIWDTAGQERFRTITTAYYRGANAIFIVFDLTNMESFTNVNRWMSDLSRYHNLDSVAMLLIGNKSDLIDSRQVDFTTAKKFANEHNMDYFETSAKDSSNVEGSFVSIADQCLKNLKPEHMTLKLKSPTPVY